MFSSLQQIRSIYSPAYSGLYVIVANNKAIYISFPDNNKAIYIFSLDNNKVIYISPLDNTQWFYLIFG